MQVTETLSDGLKRAFTVVVPAADIETKRAARLAELGKTLRLPGFRPGKVPANLVKTRYGSAVAAEVLEESVNAATREMLTERGLRPAMQPKVDVVNAAEAQDLEFKVELELLPEIPMPDFAAIGLTRLKAEPAPEALDKTLSGIAARQSEPVDVAEARGAAKGEILVVDFIGRIDGAAFEGGTANDVPVEVGGDGFIPGFTEQLEGLQAGQTRTIEVTFPADYGAEKLAGKTAHFEIAAKKLQQRELPPVDDDFAKKLGFEGLEPLRAVIGSQMQREYDQMSRQHLKRQLMDALAGTVSFTAPASLVDAEFDAIWQRLEEDRKAGKLDAEDAAKDEETLRADYRAIAERRVRLGLLLAEIGRTNAITVGNDEMTRAMRTEAARYQGQESQVMKFFRDNPQAAETLRGPIFEDKVVDFVLELAKVEDKAVSPEELAQAAAG